MTSGQKYLGFFAFFILFFPAAIPFPVLAHGGEDHGDATPKTATTDKGTVSRVARLGNLEVMLKHPLFAPDTATSARLFVTNFQTNAGFGEVSPAVEIESANGAVTEAKIAKTDTAGIFSVGFPALPNGIYTIRAKLTHGGETDTATFSSVEVKPQTTAADENGAMSWARTILIGFIFSILPALFGGLFYFVRRFSEGKSMNEETVSA